MNIHEETISGNGYEWFVPVSPKRMSKFKFLNAACRDIVARAIDRGADQIVINIERS